MVMLEAALGSVSLLLLVCPCITMSAHKSTTQTGALGTSFSCLSSIKSHL